MQSFKNGPLVPFGKDFARFVPEMRHPRVIGQLPNDVLNIALGA